MEENKTVEDLIEELVSKVDKDYYFEDGMFVEDWLRDDLQALVDTAGTEISIDLGRLPRRKPEIIFSDDPDNFVE